jgi:hypothetical protein
MSRYTQVNRADMLACLRAYGPVHLQAWAASVGYVEQSETPVVPAPAEPEPSLLPEIPPGPPQPAPDTVPQMPFYRVVGYQELAPETWQVTAPEWYNETTAWPANDPALFANPTLKPPPHLPLMPWARLWPFLKRALGAQVTTAQLDLPPILQSLARGQMLRRLPRKR